MASLRPPNSVYTPSEIDELLRPPGGGAQTGSGGSGTWETPTFKNWGNSNVGPKPPTWETPTFKNWGNSNVGPKPPTWETPSFKNWGNSNVGPTTPYKHPYPPKMGVGNALRGIGKVAKVLGPIGEVLYAGNLIKAAYDDIAGDGTPWTAKGKNLSMSSFGDTSKMSPEKLQRNYGMTQDGADLQKKYLGTGETKRLPAGFKAIDTFTDDDGETKVKLPDGSVVAPVTVAQKAKLNPLNAREDTEGGIVFNNENGSGGGWMKFNDPEVNKKMMGKLKKGRGTVSQMTIDGDKWAGATRGNTMAAIGEAYRKGTIDSKFAREMMDQALGITPAPVDNGPELLPMPMQDGGLTPAQNARIRRQQKLVMAQNKLLSDNYNDRARNKSYDAMARAQGLRQSAADARTDRQFSYNALKSEREAAAQAEKDRLTRESDMIKRFGSYYDSKDASTKAQAMKDFTMIIPGMTDVMDGAGYQSFISELEQGDLGTIIRDYDAAVREYSSAMDKKNPIFPDLIDQIPEDRNNFILSSIRDKMMKRRKAAEANPS